MIEGLLNGLWQGALVVAVAGGVIAFVPRHHAATRYAVWFASLVALVILPFAGRFSFGAPPSMIPSTVISTTTLVKHATVRAASDGGWILLALWLAGVFVCVARLAASYVRISRAMRNAVPAPQIGEGVVLSPAFAIPIAAGFLRPTVIIPTELAANLESTDLQYIVEHERAHIRRHDIVGNLMQRVFEAVLFFNPWVHLIGHQLVKEREAACDDWAVRVMSDAERYASCLANLGRRNLRTATPLLTPSAIGSRHMLIGRIARLLEGKASQLKINYVAVAGAVTLFAGLGFVLQAPNGLASTGCSADAMIVKQVRPDIPEAVARAHTNSQVTLLVTLTAQGIPSDIKLMQSSGNMTIDSAAGRAAAHSTYKPEIRNCKAVAGGHYTFHVDL